MEVINRYGTETPEKQVVFTCPWCNTVFKAKKRELGYVREGDEEEGVEPYYEFDCTFCDVSIVEVASVIDAMYDEVNN